MKSSGTENHWRNRRSLFRAVQENPSVFPPALRHLAASIKSAGKILAYSVPSPDHAVTTRESGFLLRARPQSDCRWDGWRAGIVLKRDVPIPRTSLLALAGLSQVRPPNHDPAAPAGFRHGYLGDPTLSRQGKPLFAGPTRIQGQTMYYQSSSPLIETGYPWRDHLTLPDIFSLRWGRDRGEILCLRGKIHNLRDPEALPADLV